MKAVLARDYGDVNQLFYGDTPDLKSARHEGVSRAERTK